MKVPLVRSTSWLGVVVGVMPLLALMAVGAPLAPDLFPLLAGAIWLVLILIMRHWLTGAHRRAIRLVKAGNFRAAIPAFQDAYDQMCRRPWADRFRWLLLGTASRWTYREIALCNSAFCHGQIGDGEKMRELYRRALVEFPDSVLASMALRMLNAASAKAESATSSSTKPTTTRE